MTTENMNPVVKSWLKGTDVEPPDPRHSARPIMARVAQTRQRSRWWPLPSFQRPPPAALGIPASTESQPTPIPATNGHAPTATGRTMPMFSATKFVVAGVVVALLGGLLLIAQPFERQGDGVPGAMTGGPGAFSQTGSLSKRRDRHTATLLPDGRVLVVGGCCIVDGDDVSAIDTAEVYDPASATFSAAGSLAEARALHTATRLADGRVMVVGGVSTEDEEDVLASTEVWDPATASFEGAEPLTTARARHSATLLRDGRVLFVGGGGGQVGHRSAEVWDPVTVSFSATGSLAEGRDKHTAILLPDGRVLVVGDGHELRPEPSAEAWDPVTASFSPAGSLARGRVNLSATPLLDGRVLVVGGFSGGDRGNTNVASAEVWEPTDG